jgi:hypothetical protein
VPAPNIVARVVKPCQQTVAFPNEIIYATVTVDFYDPSTHQEIPPPNGTAIKWTVDSATNDGQAFSGAAGSFSPDNQKTAPWSGSFADVGQYQIVAKVSVSNSNWDTSPVTDSTLLYPTVADVRLIALAFTSDHHVMTNKTDNFADGGTVYVKPDWQLNQSANPISQTWNSPLAMNLTLEVYPPNAPSASYQIANQSLGINLTANLSGGSGNTVPVTAGTSLPKNIDHHHGDTFFWTIQKAPSATALSQNTEPHEILATEGAPSPGSAATYKRMAFVCDSALGATDDLHIANGIFGVLCGVSNNSAHGLPLINNDWILLDKTQLGTCIDWANLMCDALGLLGSTGQPFEVYASTDANTGTPKSEVVGGKTYWLEFSFAGDGQPDNVYEGSVSAAGKYYAIWPTIGPVGSKLGILKAIAGEGATQIWAQTRGDKFGAATISTLPTPQPYPNFPPGT